MTLKQNKPLWIASLIFIYVAIAILGFFTVYFLKNMLQAPTFTNDVNNEQIAPTIVPGFKTYEITKGQSIISYPENFTVKESSYGLGVITTELRSPENTNLENPADFQILRAPKYLAKTIGQDFEAFYTMTNGKKTKIKSPIDESIEEFTKIRNRSINNHRAVEYQSKPSPNPENYDPEIGIILEDNKDLILISTREEQRETLEKMLTTFSTK